ncbi:asparagine synthase (glutamine-hydrolyzing) [Paenibacillus odorifer]|uniref:asparagine synthase (glutamine-hydrolyzing) n=1 Tax=Paenibacillus odorifer TaxID=189426 RepID=UPI0020BE45A5|nr:asparagine synthase (glutamine-hydrolyzing) [Paenibacillus odorifer]
MCGIAGILKYNGQPPQEETLKQMTGVMNHRGPNHEGVWLDSHIGLGFRRLSVIDLRDGNQPMTNEDRTLWIVFNGEIYNYKTLRDQLKLKGHHFQTQSDTEVIVHLFEEYGKDCVHHLRGMFSFAIWDLKEQSLFAARDHFGIKPFYYYKDENNLLFASEIKSILAVQGVPRKLQYQSLFSYLTFQYVPHPDTMFEHIHKLGPAERLFVNSDGEMKIEKYWEPHFQPVERSLADYAEEIQWKLKESVNLHLQSDVDRGCFLSSGIDSTAIAAMMRAEESTKTFSIGFEGLNNETIIANQTAAKLGTDHYFHILSQRDFFESIPKTVWHLDEPVADPSAIALYHLNQLAKEHVTVVLSGEGADELFGGYRIYREPNALRPITWMPNFIKDSLRKSLSVYPYHFYGKNYLLRGLTPLEERFFGNANIFNKSGKMNLLHESVHAQNSFLHPADIVKPFYDKTAHLDPTTRMQFIDMNFWLPGDILSKADKLSMAHSLELRVPFLDKEVFETASKIPVSNRIGQKTTKLALRKAMEGIVPEAIVNRPKLGFPVPIRDWLKTPISDIMFEQIRYSGIEEIFNMNIIEEMFTQHRSNKGDYSRRIWLIYIFSVWYTLFIKEDLKQLNSAVL